MKKTFSMLLASVIVLVTGFLPSFLPSLAFLPADDQVISEIVRIGSIHLMQNELKYFKYSGPLQINILHRFLTYTGANTPTLYTPTLISYQIEH